MIRILSLAFLLTGCTVNYTFTAADTGDAKSISVQTFQLEAPLAPAGLNQQFTEALRDLMLAQTKVDVKNTGGDLQYTGAITGYDVKPVGIQGNDQAGQNRLTIRVTVTYTNTLEPDKSFDSSFSRFADYGSDQQLSDVEAALIDEIFEHLTQDVFNRSLGNW
mgnify:FL=1